MLVVPYLIFIVSTHPLKILATEFILNIFTIHFYIGIYLFLHEVGICV